MTPGPWSVEATRNTKRGPVTMLMVVADAGGMPGLIVNQGPVEPRDHANAKLIAAAPDLLAALKGLLADIEDYQRINNLGGENNHWQVISRTAIAKAEGA